MQQHDHIARMVSTALGQEKLVGIVEVLKSISESVNAVGCILWEVAPWADFNSEPPAGDLFVLASWFSEHLELPLHKIPLSGSANGLAIVTQKLQNVPSMKDDERTFKHEFSIKEAKLTSMCAVPITFQEGQPTMASLCVYRNEPDHPFNDEEEQLITQEAELIPPLYQAIRDRVGRLLLSDINTILDKAEQEAKNAGDLASKIGKIKEGLKEVCREVADTFQCVETTLFLENRMEAENSFKLFATTWQDWSMQKDTYLPKKEEGLTGWVLEKKRPVRIFNLATFDDDRENLRQEYPEIDWKDSLRIRQAARQILKLPKDSALPPLSFMAAPIVRGDRLLGVIRCCTARQAPWFFVKRQLNVLELVASQISRFWNDWLQHLEEQEENRSWKTLVTEISKLNNTVQSELDQSALDEGNLYMKILHLARRVIPGADILDIRRHDEANNQLYFAKRIGQAWHRGGSKQEMIARTTKRFNITQPMPEDGSIGIRVFLGGKAISVMNAEQENYRSKTFPETRRIIVAPIGVKKPIGVLDVRGTGSKPFAAYSERMAELLGQQLGLYLSLWQSEKQQRQSQKQQRQVFEDLWHQLKSPVQQTFARAQGLVQRMRVRWHPSDEERAGDIESEVLMLRGVARKAKRVAVSLGLFKDLASEGKLRLSKTKVKPLLPEEAIKRLIEANIDTQHALEDERAIKFGVHERSFDILGRSRVRVDFDLLEQAISCLLDNAGKYSFPHTSVTVSGGEVSMEWGRFFYISVRNKGFAIASEEVEQCKERNYRGEWAKITTGEGSGIGLWVVDHIMLAHDGKLSITPTTEEGWTEVRLLFPIAN
ncbi:MAG: GAF domain-containing protein [Pyrinomonadaceae bacterium]